MVIAKADAKKVYLVTGAAGFIGYYLSKSLLNKGCLIVGVDNLNDYYDVGLKYERLKHLTSYKQFEFIKADISDKETVSQIFREYRPEIAVNLAAQAGVRYSLVNPDAYIQSNVLGFYHVLEACRQYPVEHLVYASSSSVYGLKDKGPFFESDDTDKPVSFYAATKKSNELAAYVYSYLYQIPATGLRFFTVYGPLGRPDMAYFKFTNKYFADEPISIYQNGNGDSYRDFTYIDDVIEGIERVLDRCPDGSAPHRVFNIGNSSPISLTAFIEKLEKSLSEATGKEVVFQKQYQSMKQGDVASTYASTDLIKAAVGFAPQTSVDEGLKKFAAWYVSFYNAGEK